MDWSVCGDLFVLGTSEQIHRSNHIGVRDSSTIRTLELDATPVVAVDVTT
jgi:hypothetical protein